MVLWDLVVVEWWFNGMFVVELWFYGIQWWFHDGFMVGERDLMGSFDAVYIMMVKWWLSRI